MRTKLLSTSFAALSMLLIAAATHAAPKKAAGGPAVKALDRLSTALSAVTTLDDAQKERTHQILVDGEAQLQALRQDAKGSKGTGGVTDADAKAARKAGRGQATKIIAKVRADLEAVLNTEQTTQFRQALAAAREQAKENAPERTGAGKGQGKKGADASAK